MAPEKRKGSPLPSNASVGDTVLPRKTTRKTFSVVTEGLSDNLNTLRERQRRADMTGERAAEDKKRRALNERIRVQKNKYKAGQEYKAASSAEQEKMLSSIEDKMRREAANTKTSEPAQVAAPRSDSFDALDPTDDENSEPDLDITSDCEDALRSKMISEWHQGVTSTAGFENMGNSELRAWRFQMAQAKSLHRLWRKTTLAFKEKVRVLGRLNWNSADRFGGLPRGRDDFESFSLYCSTWDTTTPTEYFDFLEIAVWRNLASWKEGMCLPDNEGGADGWYEFPGPAEWWDQLEQHIDYEREGWVPDSDPQAAKTAFELIKWSLDKMDAEEIVELLTLKIPADGDTQPEFSVLAQNEVD